ncbi:glycosyl transferase family 2 [Branchiibius hedensis]|uniref:Glycosyl transferase family 2 n=1 Tax=Branchiibius hedensis TaxID=672460 RepID=A0A2Y8ZTS8_9MICO|nr:glycosyltransferase [Branchiibius hedensis]PWJ24440.1 glycosyl transferase family 2 [Branchiibius hedensis]SSA33257.1 Glycosyl transferase family 2 [Branchiibius hedensis]
MSAESPLTLTVAVLTFRRPEQLAELLPLLFEQTERLRAAYPGRFDAGVLVVDNDPASSGAPATESHIDCTDLRYVVEPRPGISAARNRALSESANSDLLVFIDDDERPSTDWLPLMVGTWLDSGAAAVAGAVQSTFDPPLDPWIEAGGFFTRRRLPTGTIVEVAATNNLLLDLRRVRELGLTFDEEFGLTGGEDTLFTQALTASGATIVWCNEALVTDVVPTDRATRKWVLLRWVSMGNSQGRVLIHLAPSRPERTRARVKMGAGGVARIIGGAAAATAGIGTRSMQRRASGLRTAARGAGMTSAAAGYVYQEYRR